MITEAIILAGGLGTRLREAVPDLPKCMAPVAGRPFISFVIDSLRMQGIEHIVLSLGYKSEAIIEYIEAQYPTLRYSLSIEEEPLGTGGAIQLALGKTETPDILVANGDTLFKIDVPSLYAVHQRTGAETTLALKPMSRFDRYGVVEKATDGTVRAFREKQYYEEGLINGGIYIIHKETFLARALPLRFSFEKEYLERFQTEGRFAASVQEGYFIDIGIPQDFLKAQADLSPGALDLAMIDPSWTLFLDRDGVINNELPGTYVKSLDEFLFSPGSLESFPLLASRFGKIVVVSNQRGIGRGLMTEQDLHTIHAEMKVRIEAAGGRIDATFHCPGVEAKTFCRKPNPGMALKAKDQVPDIDFKRSIMVGNKRSDMQFGRACGMFTLFVTTTNEANCLHKGEADLVFPSLLHFAQALQP